MHMGELPPKQFCFYGACWNAVIPLPQGPPVRAGSADRGEDGLALPPYSMLEFAQKYFRDPQRRPQ